MNISLKKIFGALIVISAINQSYATKSIVCKNFYKYGNPALEASKSIAHVDKYLCREGYISAYSYKTKEPVVVSYNLTGASVDKHYKRHNRFRDDLSIASNHESKLQDYRRSGYDRGHLAPYAAMDFDIHSANQSFLLSNMSPQKPGLNRVGWAQLETYVRRWANMYKSIWVYDGAIFKRGKISHTIGRDKVAVPDFFFKIIYAPQKINGSKTIAFIMPNARVSRKNVHKYIVSIKEIEQKTGLKFLTKIPYSKRIKLINEKSPMWLRNYVR